MIKKLSSIHATSASHIHFKMLPNDFLASFGITFMELLYGALLSLPPIIALGFFQRKKLVGIIITTTDTKEVFGSVIKKNLLKFSPLILKSILKNPLIILRLIETLLYTQKKSGVSAEILVLAVDSSIQRNGIGSKLFHTAKKSLRDKKVTRFSVGTHANNKASNAFYKKHGGLFIFSFRQYDTIWNNYSFSTS